MPSIFAERYMPNTPSPLLPSSEPMAMITRKIVAPRKLITSLAPAKVGDSQTVNRAALVVLPYPRAQHGEFAYLPL
jgi:hypothetical protein